MSQLQLHFTGKERKQKGIEKALANANKTYDNWAEIAFNFLMDFASKKTFFMAEDVRNEAEKTKKVPVPPSKRAWGGIFQRAAREGIILKNGFKQVTNPKAHQANAAVWQSLLV